METFVTDTIEIDYPYVVVVYYSRCFFACYEQKINEDMVHVVFYAIMCTTYYKQGR